jgi:hypothetical protein
MRSPRWRRMVAALMGGWMVIILTTPMAVFACPAHGDPNGIMSHSMTHMDMGGSQHGGKQHAQCTCPGCCCAVAPVGLAAGRLVALPVVPVAVVAATPAPAVGTPRDLAPPHRQPLPLGPPALRA